ncbi:MAG: leucyl aminopeptidase family protein [Alphaproteobacteria bacterium]
MIQDFFNTPSPFLTRARKRHVPIIPLTEKSCASWLKAANKVFRTQAEESGFGTESGPKTLLLLGKDGQLEALLLRTGQTLALTDFARASEALRKTLSAAALSALSFEIVPKEAERLSAEELVTACTGWALGCYRYDRYKRQEEKDTPKLLWPKGTDKKRVNAFVGSIALLRNLVNTPANVLGPEELEKTARHIAAEHPKAQIKIVKDKVLEKDFPLIHAVGDSSPRRPRLIDLTWGDPKHPKLTLIGKGVCFDTGGLDIKPSQYMRLMKKDMGGAAHALALGCMVMETGLPVRLRILVPAVENAVSGTAFRPGDILSSRKGLTVENTNTDAEGRLILADALTLASEEKPDLIIDFATLTGSARAALGPDIPAMFSNDDKVAEMLGALSMEIGDPLWRMPLWAPYKKVMDSPIANLINSAGTPGDLIYSALFLQSFLGATSWVHLDVFA